MHVGTRYLLEWKFWGSECVSATISHMHDENLRIESLMTYYNENFNDPYTLTSLISHMWQSKCT